MAKIVGKHDSFSLRYPNKSNIIEVKREQNDVEYALFIIQRLLQNAIYHLLYFIHHTKSNSHFSFSCNLLWFHLCHAKSLFFSFIPTNGIFQTILKLYLHFKIEKFEIECNEQNTPNAIVQCVPRNQAYFQ